MLMSKENKIITAVFFLILLVALLTIFQTNKKDKTSATTPPNAFSEKQSASSLLSPQEISLKIRQGENILILDIRQGDFFQTEHIANSINISAKNIRQQISTWNTNKIIILVGADSQNKKNITEVEKLLRQNNFQKVFILNGGIKAWKENNYPLIHFGNPNSFTDQSKVSYVSPQQLKIAVETKYPVSILDIRSLTDFKSGHIVGAQNIPLNELEKRKNELTSLKEIVIYGETELEGYQASVILFELNYPVNTILKGGFQSWKENNFPIEQ